jgi:hypothetical protein
VSEGSGDLVGKVAAGAMTLREATRQVTMEKNASLISAQTANNSNSSSGRPGWTYWGLEAGVGPHVLPLEKCWASPRSILADVPRNINFAFQQLVRWLPTSRSKPEILAVPGVAEAFERLAERVGEFRRILAPLAERFRELSVQAPSEKIPVGANSAEERQLLLDVNRQQKNGRGLCGAVGCCCAVPEGKMHCEVHSTRETAS